jgi:hypothetical protein
MFRMRLRLRPLLLPLLAPGLALALAGCKTPSAQTEKTWIFACPEPGSWVTWDDGRSLVFSGADPADAGLCLAQSGTAAVRLTWGMVEATNSEGSGHRPGMASLFPAKTGANASYTATVSYPGSGIQYPFETRWRVVGFEPLQVPAGTFDTVVLERMVNGTGANATLHRPLLARGRLRHPAAAEGGTGPERIQPAAEPAGDVAQPATATATGAAAGWGAIGPARDRKLIPGERCLHYCSFPGAAHFTSRAVMRGGSVDRCCAVPSLGDP